MQYKKKKIVEQPLYKRNESNKLRVTNNSKRKAQNERMMSSYSSVQAIIDNDYYSADDNAYEYLHIEDYIGEENI
jgi:hypothetical protein